MEAFRTDTFLSEQFYKRPPSRALTNQFLYFYIPVSGQLQLGAPFSRPEGVPYENFHCISHARLIWELVTQSNSDTSIAWSYTTINICSCSNNLDLSEDKWTIPRHLLKTFFIGWWGDMKP